MTTLEAVSAADTRSRILDEAERLFRVYGYAKTTVADIAAACAMSPSNVYRFFASKSDINSAICERILSEKLRRIEAIARMPLSASERLRRIVADVYRFTVETLLDEKKVHDMIVVAIEEQWASIEAHLGRTADIIETVIADGIRLGEFPQQDTKRAAHAFHAGFVVCNHPTLVAQCLKYQNRVPPEDLADFLISALRV